MVDYGERLLGLPFPYPILNRVGFSPWTTNKLSDIA